MSAPARILLLASALLVPGCAATTLQAQAQPSFAGRGSPMSFAPLVKRVQPAVVNIAVSEVVASGNIPIPPELRGTPFEKQFRERMRNRRILGAGSGFILDPSGIIVTNNHVVGHAERIVVSLNDGTELPARVLGSDDLTDIAVIKVDPPHPLPNVPWGDSRQAEVGDWVLAAGNPFGLGGSVTAGIISARGRDLGAGPFDDFLQLDAPMNPGNSGGPTFNMDGQVIGVNTAIVSPTGGSVGIGFAIPSEIAQRVVEQLRSAGHIDRGWLGVSVEDAESAGRGRNGGVLIATVERGSPGARAGLKPGDVVTSINGQKVDTARNLVRAVAATPPGGTVRLTVRRQGHDIEISITVGRRPPEESE